MEKQASKLNQQNSNIFKAIIFTFLLTLVALPTKAQVLNDSTAVVKKDTITVQLTPNHHWQELYYEIKNNTIIVINDKEPFIDCSILVNAERKDIDKLELRTKK